MLSKKWHYTCVVCLSFDFLCPKHSEAENHNPQTWITLLFSMTSLALGLGRAGALHISLDSTMLIFRNYKLLLWQLMIKASLPLKYLWEFVGHIWKTFDFWRSVSYYREIKVICLEMSFQGDYTTRSRLRKLESPSNSAGWETMHSSRPRSYSMYCFTAWLRLPDHFSSVVLTQQQMSPSIIAGHNGAYCSKAQRRVFEHGWLGRGLAFLTLHTFAEVRWSQQGWAMNR